MLNQISLGVSVLSTNWLEDIKGVANMPIKNRKVAPNR